METDVIAAAPPGVVEQSAAPLPLHLLEFSDDTIAEIAQYLTPTELLSGLGLSCSALMKFCTSDKLWVPILKQYTKYTTLLVRCKLAFVATGNRLCLPNFSVPQSRTSDQNEGFLQRAALCSSS